MSAFDGRVRIGEAGIQVNEDEHGNKYELELVLGVMALIPVGPGQAAPLPIATLRVPLDKDSALSVFTQGLEAAKQLSKRPDIAVASDLSAVNKAAEQQSRLIK